MSQLRTAMQFSCVSLGFAALLGGASAAQADIDSAGEDASVAMIGAKVGGIAPQPFSELGSFVITGIEAAYVLPVADRRIWIGGGFYYSRPPASGGGDDMRLSGGGYDWELDQQMLIYELNGTYRFGGGGQRLVPYGRLGARVYSLRTRVDGSSEASARFAAHDEGSTELGFAAAGGADYLLGPGRLSGELGMGMSDLNQKLTGNSNTGALEVSLGYRMLF
jgi:hypothetical protein